MSAEPLGSSRFEVKSRLGAGGMGVVLEAWDRERKQLVALKMLRQPSPAGLARLKREFRSLEGVVHPNLVRLFELFEDRGRWFFTMELVRGVSFLRWVRREEGQPDEPIEEVDAAPTWDLGPVPEPVAQEPGGTCDVERLRGVLPQVASGLVALHAIGKVHQDVKPSNVVVTAEGRAVILDPGLVATAGATQRQVMGTVAYMAPEQIRGAVIGPAADWYALGVMTFEALTGRAPFEGPPGEVLHRKQTERAIRASRLVTVPEDLDDLCAELLAPEPEERPGGGRVLVRLGVAAPDETLAAPGFRGRHAELSRLASAVAEGLERRPGGIAITGESGVGKSSLLERFLAEAAPPATRVFRGRCREAEHVPFRAFDEVFDEMARAIADQPRSAADTAALRAIPAFAGLPGKRDREAVATDPVVRRRAAFAALRRALAGLGRVLIAVDDLHAADGDSLVLLEEILRGGESPPLRLCVVATARGPIDGLETLELGPLPVEEARLLAASAGASAEAAVRCAVESGGHPLFLMELLRRAGGPSVGLDAALETRLHVLGVEARRVVEVVAVHGGPIGEALIADAAGLSPDEVALVLTRLRADRLVRNAREEAVEPYHDRVRAAVLAASDVARRSAIHWDVASAMERQAAEGTAGTIARHFAAAGAPDRAFRWAVQAGEESSAALAFAQAAELYQLAMTGAPTERRGELTVRLAECYVAMGRGAKAAAAFLSAARGLAAEQAIALRSRAAEQLLASGHVVEGLAVNDEVLETLGVPMEVSGWELAKIKLRARWGAPPAGGEASLTERTRLDALWSVAGVLGMTDMLRAQKFQSLHLAEARRVGDPLRLCRAIAAEALFSGTGGTKTQRRTARLLEECARHARGNGPYGQAVHLFVTSICAYSEGRFRTALDAATGAQAILESHCVGVFWERAQTLLFRLMALDVMGRWNQVGPRVEEALRDARERGDLYTEAQIGLVGCIQPALLAGRIEEGLAELVELEKRWGPSGFEIPHYNLLVSRMMARLWMGEPEQALAALDGAWEELWGTFLAQVQFCRIEMRRLRATALIGCAAGAARRRGELARRARRDIEAIRGERVGWGMAVADLLEGSLAGDPVLLRRAAASLDQHDMTLFAGAAELRLATVIGGTEGQRFAERARETFAHVGVRDPDGATRLHAGI
jgi:tetratricopeptide (TPR) repeat protein